MLQAPENLKKGCRQIVTMSNKTKLTGIQTIDI